MIRTTSRQPWQRYLSEALGTFAIVFAGCGAAISNQHAAEAVTHSGIVFTFGLVVAAMIFTLGPISAAHFNPAVTIAFASARRFPARYIPMYIAAQCVGALAASGLHAILYPASALSKSSFGATVPSVPWFPAFIFEFVMTFFLMLVIMAVATDRRIPGVVPGIAIGGMVAVDAMFGGPLTGASMNPARSLSPAVFAGGTALRVLPLYILAPIFGAVAGALCYELLRDGQEHAQGAPADLDEALLREPGLSRQTST